ncbi:MAG: hypothetical protein CMN32_10940 [Saprospirales bacterium]|nr:hypothetical protein [Saprospirales bacterium]
MKYIVKLFLVLGLIYASGCSFFELEEKLDNPNAPTAASAEMDLVMNNVMLEFVQFVDEVSDETMPYVRLVAMTGGENYENQDSPASFDFMWSQAYSELMPDINLVIALAEEGGFTVHSGAAKILKAYIMFTLVDLFGDVPYSEAFQGVDIPSPKADPGEQVYNAAFALLDEAINDLKNPLGEISNDLYYDNNVDSWIKLANTLKLRYYVNTRLVNPGGGANVASLVSAGVIEDAADDFQFQYGSNRENPDSRHPYYSDGYETGGPSWYLSNYYMFLFIGETQTEDPRTRYYFYRQDCDETDENFFTLDCQDGPYPFHWPDGLPYCTASSPLFGSDLSKAHSGYWGRDHGNADGIPPDDLKRTAWGLYPAGGKFDANDCVDVENQGKDGGLGAGIQPIILSSYVYFMRAEAALEMNSGEDAREMLEKGIRASIAKAMSFESIAPVDPAYKPDQAQIDAYVAEILDTYDNSSDKLQVVMKEYWKALQGMGLEAFNAFRRTCRPTGMQPTREANPGDFPKTFWYPASYVNRNQNAQQKASLTAVSVFWDTNPVGCTY